MTDRLAVSWQGEVFDVRRTPAGDAGEPGDVWQVLQDGALVTSFPAEPDDAPSEVRAKVAEWLDGNRARPGADIGRQ
jgi:hypothetical protein